MPDLAGGTDQVGVIQLRRDIVFLGLGEEPAETQGFVAVAVRTFPGLLHEILRCVRA